MGKKERTLMIVAGTAPFIFGCTAVDYGFALLPIAGIVTTLVLAMLHINRNRKNARVGSGTVRDKETVETKLTLTPDVKATLEEIDGQKAEMIKLGRKQKDVRGNSNETGYF